MPTLTSTRTTPAATDTNVVTKNEAIKGMLLRL
jgi:hypothetical protein